MMPARDLATELANLADPAPPAGLAAAVLARIAQLEEPEVTRRVRVHRAPWAAIAGVLGVALTAIVLVVSGSVSIDLASPRMGRPRVAQGDLRTAATLALALAASAALYTIGLFAPLRRRPR